MGSRLQRHLQHPARNRPGCDVNANPAAFCTGPYYGNSSGIDLSLIRYSVGVGIAWISPMGPLRLSYAYPLNAEPWDRIQRFQFQIGAGF